MKSFHEWLLLRETAEEEAWELVQMGSIPNPVGNQITVANFYHSLGLNAKIANAQPNQMTNVGIGSPEALAAKKITAFIESSPLTTQHSKVKEFR